MEIVIFDTSVCSQNLGDFIIMDSVKTEIESMFPKAMICHTYTHDRISESSYKLVNKSEYSFVGGTNLLSSKMNDYKQWQINLFDAYYVNNTILMGVGWWQYQDTPNLYTKILLKRVLSSDVSHSVRDSYTKKMLSSIGITNVINTSCPTMWKLTEDHCNKIPTTKADSVVFTLTDYNKSTEKDSKLIDILLKNYQEVFFWPQGSGDLDYFKGLGIKEEIQLLSPNLNSYKELLRKYKKPLDYIGTRLHAGILALQNKRRSIIIGIDNRASEKEKDFNIKVCQRKNINNLAAYLSSDFKTEIKLPISNIQMWKRQFN